MGSVGRFLPPVGSRLRRGIGVVTMGIFLLVLGASVTSVYWAANGQGCGIAVFFVLFGLVLLVGGVVIVVVPRRPRRPLGYNPAVPPPLLPIPGAAPQAPTQVRCRYCEAMSAATLSTCPSCGAPR